MSEPLVWPQPGESAFGRTTLTCGHFGLIGTWNHPVVGRRQWCEVCDVGRIVVRLVEFE